MNKENQNTERVRKARSKNGERGQKMMSFRVDVENLEWLESQTNKGRYINDLIESDRSKSKWNKREVKTSFFLCSHLPATCIMGKNHPNNEGSCVHQIFFHRCKGTNFSRIVILMAILFWYQSITADGLVYPWQSELWGWCMWYRPPESRIGIVHRSACNRTYGPRWWWISALGMISLTHGWVGAYLAHCFSVQIPVRSRW